MAPTTRSRKRFEYRKTRSSYTGRLVSLPYKVEKPPKYECVLCERRFRSKGWVKTHFRSHPTIPYNSSMGEELPSYTHPSCWPAVEPFTWERQDALLAAKEAELDRQDVEDDDTEEVGEFKPAKDVVEQEVERLSMWWWWWTAQDDAITEALRRAPPGRLNITDLAFDDSSEGFETGLALDDQQDTSSIKHPSSAPGDSLAPIESTEDNGLHGPIKTDWLPRQQAPVAGRLWTELDFTGHNALCLPTVRQFISTCNVDFLASHEENPIAYDTIADAAMAYIAQLTPQSDIRVGFAALLQRRATSLVWNPVKDRTRLFGAVRNSTIEFFGGRADIPRRSQDEQDLTLAMEAYAGVLADKQARRRVLSYRYGPDNALDAGYDQRFGTSQR